mmetsp:Transcript_31517/g.32002  ORF Transcript_31517/g.32002 Transcript_31517/m.32002 type:complete len:182 (-) Transcript_31517:541-1086(-)
MKMSTITGTSGEDDDDDDDDKNNEHTTATATPNPCSSNGELVINDNNTDDNQAKLELDRFCRLGGPGSRRRRRSGMTTSSSSSSAARYPGSGSISNRSSRGSSSCIIIHHTLSSSRGYVPRNCHRPQNPRPAATTTTTTTTVCGPGIVGLPTPYSGSSSSRGVGCTSPPRKKRIGHHQLYS